MTALVIGEALIAVVMRDGRMISEHVGGVRNKTCGENSPDNMPHG
jgi:hypothetical protein